MPSRSDVTNFGAGPAALPTDVIEDAAQALVNYEGTGVGLAEWSHRSSKAVKIINEAKENLASYLDIPNDYEILFMHGGGSGEFAAVAYNFVGAWVARKERELASSGLELQSAVTKLKMDYIVTGGWSQKAADEAKRLFGSEHVNVAATSKKSDGTFGGTIPDESTWNLSQDAAMVYYCDNETVDGVEFPAFPTSLAPGANGPIVVADMSSNILSRTIPIKNFSAIFFGAQKNLGMTGITVVVINKRFLPQPSADLMRKLGLPIPPRILEYDTIAKNNSLYNTLSIFDVYVAGQVLKRLLRQHPKVQGQQAIAEEKAQLIYGALEAHSDLYRIIPDKSVRSRMNICFRIEGGDASEKAFLDEAESLGFMGLKGHRSLGGIRASNYNSISPEEAKKLAKFINTFASQRGALANEQK
ncbi:hypothetical protein RJ55_02380 [Drechmeria coniospora]|nr:hypothetical protein RJ55_02380 [Drechmeria coniospora]